MAQPVDRMIWDELPVADTRPAMKGGVPFFALFPIFFVPAVLTILTWNIFWMALIPALWSIIKWAYVGNPNRPLEWMLWLVSGAALSDWKEWGGVTEDAHGRPDLWNGLE